MSKMCRLENGECVYCRWKNTTKSPDDAVSRKCPVGGGLLGDRIESGLSVLGVTKERYIELKKAIGLPGDCWCSMRQDVLNLIHEYAREHGWVKAIAEARNIYHSVSRSHL